MCFWHTAKVAVYGGWVDGVVVAMVIRAFLFASLFARSLGGASSITATVVEVFVCVCVFVCSCVRAFVCSCIRAFMCSCVRVFVCVRVRSWSNDDCGGGGGGGGQSSQSGM